MQRSSHAVWDCGYHIVWATKRRRRALGEAHELWSPGYFVRTVGDRVTAEMVKRYIDTHGERAALGPVQAEFFP